jgi:hypothetical protein
LPIEGTSGTYVSFDDYQKGYFKPLIKFEDFEINMDNFEKFEIYGNKWFLTLVFRFFRKIMITSMKRKF